MSDNEGDVLPENLANNVKNFTKPKRLTPEEDDDAACAECMAKGIESFQQELETATAMLAITFDKVNVPRIIWAGALDPVFAMGAVEIAKYELLNAIASED